MNAVVYLPAAVQAYLWPPPPSTCDWGYCPGHTVAVRYAPECGPVDDACAWLGVCRDHAEPVGNDDFKPRGPVKAGGGGRCCSSPRRPR